MERDLKTLLLIVDANIDMKLSCFCINFLQMEKSKIINEDEHNSLKIFIFNNAPKRENSNFSWDMHDWVSRKKWLKTQIKKL